jgi:hypothetical protein
VNDRGPSSLSGFDGIATGPDALVADDEIEFENNGVSNPLLLDDDRNLCCLESVVPNVCLELSRLGVISGA